MSGGQLLRVQGGIEAADPLAEDQVLFHWSYRTP